MCRFSLDKLKPYNACVVEEIEETEAKARLADLGILPGTSMVWLFRAPCGEPTAYYVRGAVIALRACDASRIIVKGTDERDET